MDDISFYKWFVMETLNPLTKIVGLNRKKHNNKIKISLNI